MALITNCLDNVNLLRNMEMLYVPYKLPFKRAVTTRNYNSCAGELGVAILSNICDRIYLGGWATLMNLYMMRMIKRTV